MEEQVEKQERVTVKALEKRIADLEKYAADRYTSLELKYMTLNTAHKLLQLEFEAYKKKGKWTKQDAEELAKLLAEQVRLQGTLGRRY